MDAGIADESVAAANVRNGSKQDISRRLGTRSTRTRFSGMDGTPQKLRSLARQARTLSATVCDRKRIQALHDLARLYERQAEDCEAHELA